jgi:hypothetical protein
VLKYPGFFGELRLESLNHRTPIVSWERATPGHKDRAFVLLLHHMIAGSDRTVQ